MKSKKRHYDSVDESAKSEVTDKSSTSSESESEESSASEPRYKKKKKRFETSESESHSEDKKRPKKRKHKKKKKKHSKKKRRSHSIEDVSEDDFTLSDGEVATKKKRKHKNKHSKRSRSYSKSGDERPIERRLHSVVNDRRVSSDQSQQKRTYYQKEYRRSPSVEEKRRPSEVHRFYRGSSKENRSFQHDSYNYDREKSDRYASYAEKYERNKERYNQHNTQYHTNAYYGGRPKEYEDYKRGPGYEEDDYHRRRDEHSYREDLRGADPRYNNIVYEERSLKKKDLIESKDYRERRPVPRLPHYREKEFSDKKDRFQEASYTSTRARDVRDERPSRADMPPPGHHRNYSKSRDQDKRREMKEPSDRYRGDKLERSREEKVEREAKNIKTEKFERGGRDQRAEVREEDQMDRRSATDHSRAKRTRFDTVDDKKEYGWGKVEVKKEGDKKDGEKEKPNFGLSGKLTADANTVNGVVIKYTEPDDAKQPKRRWRFYPFKGDKALPILYIHRQSCFVIGRDKKIVDIPLDHPSISKQHSALQFRATPFTRADGTTSRRVRPYIIDLESSNGTFVNNKKIEPRRYVELLERDVVKFGFSEREYVLLHENSKDDALDDDQDVGEIATADHIKQVKKIKQEEAEDG